MKEIVMDNNNQFLKILVFDTKNFCIYVYLRFK